VKCQYDTNYRTGEAADWELVSFELKK
jgi:hypothetical protein